MAGEGFEPSKAEPGDLQSPPIGRFDDVEKIVAAFAKMSQYLRK